VKIGIAKEDNHNFEGQDMCDMQDTRGGYWGF